MKRGKAGKGRERKGRAGKRQPAGQTPAPPRALPALPCPALLPRRLRALRAQLARPAGASGRGGPCRGPAGRMLWRCPQGCPGDAREMPGVLRPRLPGWAHLQPRRDADRGPCACATSAVPGLGGALLYPKLGGKAAAWSGDEGEGLFQAPGLWGVWLGCSPPRKCCGRAVRKSCQGEAVQRWASVCSAPLQTNSAALRVAFWDQQNLKRVIPCRGAQTCSGVVTPPVPGLSPRSSAPTNTRTPSRCLLPPSARHWALGLGPSTSQWLFPARHLRGMSATQTTCLQALLGAPLCVLFAVPFHGAHFTSVPSNPGCCSVPFPLAHDVCFFAWTSIFMSFCFPKQTQNAFQWNQPYLPLHIFIPQKLKRVGNTRR